MTEDATTPPDQEEADRANRKRKAPSPSPSPEKEPEKVEEQPPTDQDEEPSRKRKAPNLTPEKTEEQNSSGETDEPADKKEESSHGNNAAEAVATETPPSVETAEKEEKETTATTEPPKAEGASKNPYDDIRYCIVTNDGKHDSLVKLVGLKQLFAKQLPKMPRPYIARLVFDRRHKSLAILSNNPQHKGGDDEIIGAICYRRFEEMRFAEIAFCAVSGSQQVKGYGTKLMNLLKRHAVAEGIEYFITYADNYAIGYFKKQGFTKSISMPKGRYHGLIKDYDGGTMMECYVHPSVDFTRIPEMIKAQRAFLLERIKVKARSHRIVYDPLPNDFSPNLEGVSRANEAAARAMAIPGVSEAGWTMADLLASTGGNKEGDRQKNVLKSELLALVRKAQEQQYSWPFREPVDTGEVKDYLDVIKEPIDLSEIEKRVRKGDWYKSKQMLYADLMLMVNNCKLYNDEDSTYYECAASLEKFLAKTFNDL